MARLDDLDRYFDPGLTLTVKGKEYVVPLPSAELGLWCQRAAQAAGQISAASTEDEVQAAVDRVNALPELEGDLTLPQRTLGTAYQQMVADGVEHPYIEFCGSTAYLWIIGGEEAAARFWTSGGRPEAWGPGNRAQRRQAARTGQTSTGAEPGTLTPASTSGTRSPSRSPGSGRARRSRGRRS